MGRTAVNVMGNCIATAVVARWEGVFDDRKMHVFAGDVPGPVGGGRRRRGGRGEAWASRRSVKVLVTGAAGQLGAVIVRRFRAAGHEVGRGHRAATWT